MIIVTLWFLNSFVFKMFSIRSKTQNRRFQIPPVEGLTRGIKLRF